MTLIQGIHNGSTAEGSSRGIIVQLEKFYSNRNEGEFDFILGGQGKNNVATMAGKDSEVAIVRYNELGVAYVETS